MEKEYFLLSEKDMTKLSHIISYALRHNPLKYRLELDKEGWTSLDYLITALLGLYRNNEWYGSGSLHHHQHITRKDIEEMIARSDKTRFELKDDKIRALYGHSSALHTKVNKIPAKPPSILYHGTSPLVIDSIMSDGLRPMNRQYVHLSTNENTAIQVGKRKTDLKEEPVIIAVSALEAYHTGIHFYYATDFIWLTDYIHPNFMKLLTINKTQSNN
jgi:putative RNA 2'-phosphotransferase